MPTDVREKKGSVIQVHDKLLICLNTAYRNGELIPEDVCHQEKTNRNVFAVDAAGNIVWQIEEINPNLYVIGFGRLDDGYLYAYMSFDQMYRLDPETGKLDTTVNYGR